MEQSKLFCKGGGCTAKLGAGVLSRVLERLPKFPADPNLLIGFDSKDDAAVYKLIDDVAVVQNLDFFPLMMDDAYTLWRRVGHGRPGKNSIEHCVLSGKVGPEYPGRDDARRRGKGG